MGSVTVGPRLQSVVSCFDNNKIYVLFSTNQVQVFKCVSGFKRIQEVFFLKRNVYEDSGLFKYGIGAQSTRRRYWRSLLEDTCSH